jgi:acyl-CoA thioester hydrolase
LNLTKLMKDHQIQVRVRYSETDQMELFIMEITSLILNGKSEWLETQGFRIKYGRKWHCASIVSMNIIIKVSYDDCYTVQF